MTDERAIWLAALLHDIGKFWENIPPADVPSELRAAQKYQHEAYGAWFVRKYLADWTDDPQAVEQIIVKHHQPSLPDEVLVQIADWLASYERVQAGQEEAGGRGKRETLLRSILSRVQGADAKLYHPLQALKTDRETLFPLPEDRAPLPDYARVWNQFLRELQKVTTPQRRTLQALLFKYFWAAPSDRSYEDIPDISLYHHLVAAAAIAVCLSRTGLTENDLMTLSDALKTFWNRQPQTPAQQAILNQPVALLVKGDISGTQDFLYLLTSRGAARGLRGRSFYLQLLTEVVSEWMLRRLQLPLTNRLYAGGGHFYLLVPYRECEQVDALRAQIAQKLWQAHRGDLSLNIGAVPVAPIDFVSSQMGGEGFTQKWKAVSEDVADRKQRRWIDLGAEQMAQHLFTPYDEGTTAEEMCQVCHGEWKAGEDTTDEGVRKCRRCASFERLGMELRHCEYLVRFYLAEQELPHPRPTWQEVLRTFGVEVHPLSRRKDGGLQLPSVPVNAQEVLIERVGDTDFLNDDTLNLADHLRLPACFDFRLLGEVTPTDEQGNVVDYDYLANASQGVPWLGVLRMDVDSLGQLFRYGLGEDTTLSRVATLSGSMRLFFEAYVPLLCREVNAGGQEKVYLLYAGGDDLFVVGSWSVLPVLAQRIRDEFREYAGGDHVTVSAGIAIEHEKYPPLPPCRRRQARPRRQSERAGQAHRQRQGDAEKRHLLPGRAAGLGAVRRGRLLEERAAGDAAGGQRREEGVPRSADPADGDFAAVSVEPSGAAGSPAPGRDYEATVPLTGAA
ncbi:MAG: type III-A CRISPR-associated protein Cas10/Csm1 [Armatimonadota bacterium]|nr:MAG: type III-A CRISPR-associated protein Cas10/Csm1 [Armatimonadota bacterium]